MYRDRMAGVKLALEAFGLTHATPKPPPTWSQRWQEEPLKTVDKRVKIPSVTEKSI